MKKSHSTKKALLASIVSLCLCIAMLAGTTFAWFTDSVSSENNIITAGNLDIELYWSTNAENWTKVDGNTNIFKENTLWEPGHTEVVYLKVVNEGSLALKYQLGVNIAEEIEGVNKAGDPFKLSNFIKFGVVETAAKNYYGTRTAALEAVKDDLKIISAGYSNSSKLYPKNNVDGYATEEYATLVVTMPEEVNNDANHNGVNVPSIKLGLNLFATQCSYEDDSYGDDYDENAWHPDMKVYSANDLKSALYNGKTNIALMGDIDLDEELVLPDGVVMDMNGCTLSVQDLTTEGNLVISNGTLELPAEGCVYTNGNQNITLENVVIDSDDLSVEAYTGGTVKLKNVTLKNTSVSNPVQNYGGTLILENVTVSQEGDANTAWYSSALQVINQIKKDQATGKWQTVSQANTTVNGGHYVGKKALMISAPGGNVTINNGTFEGSEYVIQSDFAPQNYLDGSNYESVVTINGGTFKGKIKTSAAAKLLIKGGTFTADPTAYVADGYQAEQNADGTYTVSIKKDALNNLFTNVQDGGTVALPEGTYTIPAAVAGKDITIEGVGDNTVIDLTKVNNVGNASITFKNLHIQGKNSNDMSGFGIQSTTGHIAYENCTFDGAVTNEYYGSVSYKNCTFTGMYYITTYAVTSATFENCVFDRADSRAILVYSHGNNPVNVTVKDCTFKAAAKGYTGVPAWTAAVEVDTTNISSAGTTVTIENCTYDANYNGIVRDKSAAGKANAVITVDGERTVFQSTQLNAAIADGETEINLMAGNYIMTNTANGTTLKGVDKEKVVLNNDINFAGNAGMNGAISRRMNFENLTFENTVFTMENGGNATFTNVHFAAGVREAYGSGVVFNNCTFGSNSQGYALHFQKAESSVGGVIKLNGCKFLGGKVHLGGLRTYEFTNCDFAAGTDFGVWTGATLEGCTVDGVAITADNIATLFPNLIVANITIK